MKDPTSSKQGVDRVLGGQPVRAWAGGDFFDRKIVAKRTVGAIAATDTEVAFCCKTLFGAKSDRRPRASVKSAEVKAMSGGGVSMPNVNDLYVEFTDGVTWRLGFPRGGDVHALARLLNGPKNP